MSNGGTRETIRQDLELFWDNELQKARSRYFRAAAEFHRHILQHGEDLPAAAGSRRAEAEAFADYCRVLATFTELVAIGTAPASQRPAY